MNAARRLYRWALRLLPADLERKHGAAMEGLFHRELQRVRRERGRWGVAASTGAALWDVVRQAARERARSRAHGTTGTGRGRGVMDELRRNLAHAVRALVRAPRFTLVVVVTLALGIGANTAIFSVVDGVLLRPLPFPEPTRIVHLAWDRNGSLRSHMPHYKVAFWRERTRTLEALTTYRSTAVQVEWPGSSAGQERLTGLAVDHGFFETVGLRLELGRGFQPAEQEPGAGAVAVVSYRVWAERMGAAPDALGRTVRLDGRPHTVVGVLPPAFVFPYTSTPVDVIVPLAVRPDARDEGENYPALGRLADGVGEARAQRDLERVWSQFRAEHADIVNPTDRGMRLASYQALFVDDVGRTLWILFGAIALVLLIACANVASLLLARATDRGREMAVRAALGASRGRLMRQVLTESAVLALVGGGLGLALAGLGMDVLLAMSPYPLPRAAEIGLDGRVVAFTLVTSLLTGLAFGLPAALPGARAGLSRHLGQGTRNTTTGGRARRVLLAAEAALSMVLLVGAGLLVATLIQLTQVDPGFDAGDVVTLRLPGGYGTTGDQAAGLQLEDAVREALAGAPGVTGAAWVSSLPLERGLNLPVGPEGRPDDVVGAVEWRAVSPGYLDALDVALVRGRDFGAQDRADGPPVVLVNEAFARHFFPGGAVGQHVEIGKYRGAFIAPGFEAPPARVVGVVADQRDISLRAEAPRTVYVPRAQVPEILWQGGHLVVESPDPAEAARAGRAALARVAPGLPPAEVRPLASVVSSSLGAERFHATLMAVFALLALVLTAFGIYGVVSYGVRQRRREIGIRMALGARRRSVVGQVTRQGLTPVVAGLLAGGALALALSRFLASLLWGVSPTDPITVAAVALLLASVALLACWLPARDAARTEPVRALAQD